MLGIKDDFVTDIIQLKGLVSMLTNLDSFKSTLQNGCDDANAFVAKSIELQDQVKINSLGLPILNGTIVLYLSGRFESFVRELFEEYAIRVAKTKENFSDLPEKMKTELLRKSVEVIGNNKKYGFDNSQRDEFIDILHKNFNEDNSLKINHKCLSITSTNMRSDVVGSMFKLFDIDMWTEAGKQASLKTFISERLDKDASAQAKGLLNEIMDVRNNIAHPADSISWPDKLTIIKYCEYFEVLANIIYEVSNLHLSTLDN